MLKSDLYNDNQCINVLIRKIIANFGLLKRIDTFTIDLRNHWLKPIYSSWKLLLFVALMRFFFEFTQTIVPFLVGQLFLQQNIAYLIAIIIIMVINPIEGVMLENSYSVWSAKLLHSFRVFLHKFFLYVDPINHSTRSSGQILSKMNRMIASLENFIDIIVYNGLSIVFSLLSLIIIFITVAPFLTFVVTISLIITLFLSYLIAIKLRKPSQKYIIAYEDRFKATLIENIQQNFFIRGIFATQNQHNKAENQSFETAVTQSAVWLLLSLSFQFLWVIQSVFTISIIGYIYYLVTTNILEPIIALTLATTYLRLSMDYMYGMGRVVKIYDAYNEIEDTWVFMKQFGTQTIPIDKTEKQMLPE